MIIPYLELVAESQRLSSGNGDQLDQVIEEIVQQTRTMSEEDIAFVQAAAKPIEWDQNEQKF